MAPSDLANHGRAGGISQDSPEKLRGACVYLVD